MIYWRSVFGNSEKLKLAYLEFAQHSLPQLLEEIEGKRRRDLTFQQSFTQPHFTTDDSNWLTDWYWERVAKVFVWGFMKSVANMK